MKNFFFIYTISLLLLSSCGAQKHIKLSQKHLKKAIAKGAVITNEVDTVYLNEVKTVYDTILRDSVRVLEKTITIHEKGEVRFISKRDKREESRLKKLLSKQRFRLSKDSLEFIEYRAKQENRTARTVVRSENKKSNWWKWFLGGLLLGLTVTIILKFIKKAYF